MTHPAGSHHQGLRSWGPDWDTPPDPSSSCSSKKVPPEGAGEAPSPPQPLGSLLGLAVSLHAGDLSQGLGVDLAELSKWVPECSGAARVSMWPDKGVV